MFRNKFTNSKIYSFQISKIYLEAGLLTKDIRLKEIKNYGKEGARRAYTWFVFVN